VERPRERRELDRAVAERGHGHAEEHRVQVEANPEPVHWPPAQTEREQQSEDEQDPARAPHEEVRGVQEPYPEVEPALEPRRDTARALVMADAALAVIEKADRDLSHLEVLTRRLQDHL